MNTFNPQALEQNGETVVSETWTHPDTCGFSPCPHKERRQAGHDQYAGEASLYHRWVISENRVCSGDNNHRSTTQAAT